MVSSLIKFYCFDCNPKISAFFGLFQISYKIIKHTLIYKSWSFQASGLHAKLSEVALREVTNSDEDSAQVYNSLKSSNWNNVTSWFESRQAIRKNDF